MLYNIVGTIASGKTTLVDSLKGGTPVYFKEPVDEWKEYFDDMNNNLCPKTIYALQEKVYEYYHSVFLYVKENPDAIVFMERSHVENIFCFVLPITLGYLQGTQDSTQLLKDIMELVTKLMDEYKEIKETTKISTIYLPLLTPEELTERVRKRNQPNDKYLSIEFFKTHVNIYKHFIHIFCVTNDTTVTDSFLMDLYPNVDDLSLIRDTYTEFFKKCEFLKK